MTHVPKRILSVRFVFSETATFRKTVVTFTCQEGGKASWLLEKMHGAKVIDSLALHQALPDARTISYSYAFDLALSRGFLPEGELKLFGG